VYPIAGLYRPGGGCDRIPVGPRARGGLAAFYWRRRFRGRRPAPSSNGCGSSVDEKDKPQPVFAGFTKAQLQLLAIGAVAMLLPLLFIIIIFAINFGGLR
jgi:hypothetical protein